MYVSLRSVELFLYYFLVYHSWWLPLAVCGRIGSLGSSGPVWTAPLLFHWSFLPSFFSRHFRCVACCFCLVTHSLANKKCQDICSCRYLQILWKLQRCEVRNSVQRSCASKTLQNHLLLLMFSETLPEIVHWVRNRVRRWVWLVP